MTLARAPWLAIFLLAPIGFGQTTKADWVSQVKNKPFMDNREFNFASQQPGGTLAIGNNTITMRPVPAGVNNGDTKHYLWVSGGTGTAEACLIVAGGSGTAGQSSGTIAINCAHAHSGAWTIAPANCGITEAEQSLVSRFGGGQVVMPPQNCTVRAAIPYKQNVTFAGSGTATILTPGTASTVVWDADVPLHSASGFAQNADNVAFRDFMIDGSSWDGENSVYGIREMNSPSSTEVFSIEGVFIDGVHFNNVKFAVYLQRAYKVRIENSVLYANSTLTFADSVNTLSYFSAAIDIGHLQANRFCMQGTSCTNGTLTGVGKAYINCYTCEGLSVHESGLYGQAGATSVDGIDFIGSSEDLQAANNTFENLNMGIRLFPLTYSSVAHYPDFVQISGNAFDGVWGYGVDIFAGTSTTDTAQCFNVSVVNNAFTNVQPQAGAGWVYVGAYSNHILLTGNMFMNLSNTLQQVGVAFGAHVRDARFGANSWQITNALSGGTSIGIATDVDDEIFGLSDQVGYNFPTFVLDAENPVASAGTITLPVGRGVVTVTGTTGITGITAQAAGARALLLFTGILTLTDGSNLKLAGNLTTAANTTLRLYSDGTNWIEEGRSVN